MNLPKAKRDSALYLSVAHVKSSMLDKLMPYLEGADDNFKVSTKSSHSGIQNLDLSINTLKEGKFKQNI